MGLRSGMSFKVLVATLVVGVLFSSTNGRKLLEDSTGLKDEKFFGIGGDIGGGGGIGFGPGGLGAGWGLGGDVRGPLGTISWGTGGGIGLGNGVGVGGGGGGGIGGGIP